METPVHRIDTRRQPMEGAGNPSTARKMRAPNSVNHDHFKHKARAFKIHIFNDRVFWLKPTFGLQSPTHSFHSIQFSKMRNLFIIGVYLSSFCFAIPFNFAGIGKFTPQLATGSLHDGEPGTHTLSESVVTNANNCIFLLEKLEMGRKSTNGYKCGSKAQLDRHIPSKSSKDVILHKERKGIETSKLPMIAGDGSSGPNRHRRAPLLGFLQDEATDHHNSPETSTLDSYMEPTQTSSLEPHRTVKLKEEPAQSREIEGNKANRWGGGYWDWRS